MHQAWLFMLSFSITFSVVFMKSFQVKNMVAGKYLPMAIIGAIIGASEVLAAQTSVAGGRWIMVTGALGSSIGIVLAVALHDRIFRVKPVPIRSRSVPLSPRSYRRV